MIELAVTMDAIDRARTAASRRPWWHVGQRVLGNPFTSLGLNYCPRCQSEQDCDTVSEHRGTTYVFRVTCNRCGRVVKAGVWDGVALLGGPTRVPWA